MNAPILPKRERTIPMQDGEETIRFRVREYDGGNYIATDLARPDLAVGYGISELDAIADLLGKIPRAESEREERCALAAKWDHDRDERKHSERV